jgi:hypothetical protein
MKSPSSARLCGGFWPGKSQFAGHIGIVGHWAVFPSQPVLCRKLPEAHPCDKNKNVARMGHPFNISLKSRLYGWGTQDTDFLIVSKFF